MTALTIILFVIGLGMGAGGIYFVLTKVGAKRLLASQEEAEKIKNEAEAERKRILKEAELLAKDYAYQAKQEFERDSKKVKEEQNAMQQRLLHREETLDKKIEFLDRKEMDNQDRVRKLQAQEQELKNREEKYQKLLGDAQKELERIAGMTATEAKKQLMDDLTEEAKHEAAKKIKQIEEEAREEAEKKAKEILGLAIDRYAGDYVTERTVTVVALPNDEMKGRIIGREGRNIRALEALTGVDLIVDDTPEAVVLSSFNAVQREIARLSLERLIQDGRIHPARIEEIVNKAEKEVMDGIREAGQQATFDLGVHGINPEIIKLIGRLKYRTSYGQNQYRHAMEVAFLCGIMASELGINVKKAKRAGLLHDIGKAVDHEVEGPHAQIGAELAKKYGESPAVVEAIGGHHNDDPGSLLGNLIQAADALSGARPGARREMLETYVKRLEDLEKIANSFKGIEKSYAIQAGREIRVLVESDKINDEQALILSKDIAKKIEEELTYPGQIRVMVIRETRAVEIAK
ncbi:MAG TPA: ribonuclease Y [bacterium]|nr:ribonuclease Y [bacterium]